MDTETFALSKDEYHHVTTTKRQICLHFTAGYSARGAYSSFVSNKGKTATAFVLERDGKVYQLFDPNYWALHIYRHKRGEDTRLYQIERQTIGIEIVNIGPLDLGKTEEDKNVLYSWTGKRYCTLDETSKYIHETYRNKHYWQTFTAEQYHALKELVFDLSSAFNIPIMNDPLGGAIDYWPLDQMHPYYGLTTHGNYRRDKYDIGPAFDWTNLGMVR